MLRVRDSVYATYFRSFYYLFFSMFFTCFGRTTIFRRKYIHTHNRIKKNTQDENQRTLCHSNVAEVGFALNVPLLLLGGYRFILLVIFREPTHVTYEPFGSYLCNPLSIRCVKQPLVATQYKI
jgi:hypothetical protein